MLNSINLDDKSYEDLMAEALSKIPLYSDEWTNFNRSDPGVTILQNLSAFTLLQRGSINQVTDEVLRALLGLEVTPAQCYQDAKVLAQLALDPRMIDMVLRDGRPAMEAIGP